MIKPVLNASVSASLWKIRLTQSPSSGGEHSQHGSEPEVWFRFRFWFLWFSTSQVQTAPPEPSSSSTSILRPGAQRWGTVTATEAAQPLSTLLASEWRNCREIYHRMPSALSPRLDVLQLTAERQRRLYSMQTKLIYFIFIYDRKGTQILSLLPSKLLSKSLIFCCSQQK